MSSMWSAIKSDLVSFVTTVKDDTANAIHRVIGDEPAAATQRESEQAQHKQLVTDLTRSFNTYAQPVEEAREFQRFMGKFSLPAKAPEIAQILDAEPDVARFYAELVPAAVSSASEFWGRYFYRLSALSKPNALLFDHDDEDESADWDKEEEAEAEKEAPSAAALQSENSRLRGVVKSLVAKIAELERDVHTRDEELRGLRKTAQRIQQVAEAGRFRRSPVASGTSGDAVDRTPVSSGASEQGTATPGPGLSDIVSAMKGIGSATIGALSATKDALSGASKERASDGDKRVAAAPAQHTASPDKPTFVAKPTIAARPIVSAKKPASAPEIEASPSKTPTKEALVDTPIAEPSEVDPAHGKYSTSENSKPSPAAPLADVEDEESSEWS